MQANDKYIERVDAVLARSWAVEGFVACGSIATAGLVAAMPAALELQLGVLVWIAASALVALRRARPGRRLRVAADGAVEVGESVGQARDGSFVAPWLVVVRWRPVGAWWDRSLLVAPDMLGADDFRRLRVLLRWG